MSAGAAVPPATVTVSERAQRAQEPSCPRTSNAFSGDREAFVFPSNTVRSKLTSHLVNGVGYQFNPGVITSAFRLAFANAMARRASTDIPSEEAEANSFMSCPLAHRPVLGRIHTRPAGAQAGEQHG
jgi:hypothetical protein